MGFFELFLIGVSLSMDAFAVALCKGMSMSRLKVANGLVIALFFGGFQAIMPLAGWALGKQFESYITSVDHWIAFGLLAFIGGKMIYESLKGEECPAGRGDVLDIKELFMLAVATSIDALAVGITFAFLQVEIGKAVLLIGATTFLISFLGILIGRKFGTVFKSKAELMGGIVLILIGGKIFLEHSGLL